MYKEYLYESPVATSVHIIWNYWREMFPHCHTEQPQAALEWRLLPFVWLARAAAVNLDEWTNDDAEDKYERKTDFVWTRL